MSRGLKALGVVWVGALLALGISASEPVPSTTLVPSTVVTPKAIETKPIVKSVAETPNTETVTKTTLKALFSILVISRGIEFYEFCAAFG